jgi:hypothetical protein
MHIVLERMLDDISMVIRSTVIGRVADPGPGRLTRKRGIVHRRPKPQQQRRKASQTARGSDGPSSLLRSSSRWWRGAWWGTQEVSRGRPSLAETPRCVRDARPEGRDGAAPDGHPRDRLDGWRGGGPAALGTVVSCPTQRAARPGAQRRDTPGSPPFSFARHRLRDAHGQPVGRGRHRTCGREWRANAQDARLPPNGCTIAAGVFRLFHPA